MSINTDRYCINPNCPNPSDQINANERICQNCRSQLLLQDRYQVIRPLGNGGFGQTFEVDDQGTLKVLKVLNPATFSDPRSKQKAVELFQQEATLLNQLHHSGIPKVEPNGYFLFSPLNCREPLHCLIMEKIEGLNLQEWQKNQSNRPITIEQAIDWLKQLTKILQQIHQSNYFHRDIKPSNIMLRPNGQLALIDFGAVKEFTQTYFLQENVTGTRIGSPGYAPLEQVHGRAVPQSDFFALGRTFAHLLTGKHPLDLHEDPQTGILSWQNFVPHSSNLRNNFIDQLQRQSLLDFINELMQPLWQKRPKNTRIILNRLKKISHQSIIKLVTGTAVSLGLGVIGSYWYTTGINGCSKILLRGFPTGDSLSCGEEILVPYAVLPEMQQGVNAFAVGKYKDSVSLLEKAWQQQHNPETLIYLNNARLTAENAKAYTIAVVAPLADKSLDTGHEILRGVAQAQDQFNKNRKPGQVGLKVLIANDENNPIKAKKIAEALVSKDDVLAVVGHYASEVTLAAMPIYERHQMVLMSPTSTSEDLSNRSPFFFRIPPSDRSDAQTLALYLTTQTQQRKAAVFYNPNSNFSNSIRNEFHRSFKATGGQVVQEFDLSVPSFTAKTALERAYRQGANVVVLLPDGQTNAYAFRNAIKVINANDKKYSVVGVSTLYGPEVLQLVGLNSGGTSPLTVEVPWHSLNSPNLTFPAVAQNLWGGDVSWRTALAYDAASALITAFQSQAQPNRTAVKNVLANPQFKALGATGAISFRENRDRNEPVNELVKVVQSNCMPFGFRFVPVTYSTAQVESLENCGAEQ